MTGNSAFVKKLKERIRQQPDSKLFLSLAEELKKLDRLDDAISILIDGIKRNPEFIAAHLTLGRWYLSSNMFMEAKREFSEAIDKSPGNSFARRGLAEANKNLGIPEQTEGEYLKPPEKSPEEQDAAIQLAPKGTGAAITAEDYVADTDARELDSVEKKLSGAFEEAERLIAEGHYRKALGIYNNVLQAGGDDKKLLQRIEELKALIKLVGMNKEAVVGRLERFSFLVKDRFITRRAEQKKTAAKSLDRLMVSIKKHFTPKGINSLPENF